MIFKYIHLRVFLISFLVGLVIVYFSLPQKNIIMVLPNTEDNDTDYVDDNDQCYSFDKYEVECPSIQ